MRSTRGVQVPRRRLRGKVVLVVLSASLLAGLAAIHLDAQEEPGVIRVSLDSAGNQAGGSSFFPALSADGRFVAFKSDAPNLDQPPPEQSQLDVFVYDRETGVTQRVSVAARGVPRPGNDNSLPPALNDDGRYIAFASAASDLVDGDTNGSLDVFVRDRLAGTTEIVSLASNGSQGQGGTRDVPPAISGDGRLVVFETTASLAPGDPNTLLPDVYVFDRETRTIELASVRTVTSDPDHGAFAPAMSGDGCVIAFVSASRRLVPDGEDTDEKLDVYVRDRCAVPPVTERISVNHDGLPASGGHSQASLMPPSVDISGRFVAFESDAPDLVPGDTNGATDIFLRDRLERHTERVSINTYGEEADGASSSPSLSGDARFVVFASVATNLLPAADTNGRSDIFLRDRVGGQTCRVSASVSQAAGDSVAPVISRDGQWIAFESTASDLVPGDTNGTRDIFLVPNRLDLLECPPTLTPTSTATPIPTETPTVTLTPAATGTSTPTPTGPTATPTPTGGTLTPTPTGGTLTPARTATPTGGTLTPTPSATSTGGTLTPTPTSGPAITQTATPGGGGGGGCGCEIDPPRNKLALAARDALAFLAPLLLIWWRGRRTFKER